MSISGAGERIASPSEMREAREGRDERKGKVKERKLSRPFLPSLWPRIALPTAGELFAAAAAFVSALSSSSSAEKGAGGVSVSTGRRGEEGCPRVPHRS